MALIFIPLILLIFAYHSMDHEIEYLQQTINYIQYLGGYPLAFSRKNHYGTLYMSKDKITFWNDDKNEILFEIPFQQIKNCTLETKESLTGGKIVLFRIFKCALKKNKQYIRIEFKNELSDYNNAVFYSPITPSEPIIQTINERRIDFIKNKRFEKGAV